MRVNIIIDKNEVHHLFVLRSSDSSQPNTRWWCHCRHRSIQISWESILESESCRPLQFRPTGRAQPLLRPNLWAQSTISLVILTFSLSNSAKLLSWLRTNSQLVAPLFSFAILVHLLTITYHSYTNSLLFILNSSPCCFSICYL